MFARFFRVPCRRLGKRQVRCCGVLATTERLVFGTVAGRLATIRRAGTAICFAGFEKLVVLCQVLAKLIGLLLAAAGGCELLLHSEPMHHIWQTTRLESGNGYCLGVQKTDFYILYYQ